MTVFVTGTDTDVGKTLVCAWLVHHWKAAYWKPIQAGFPTDSDTIRSLVPDAEILPSAWTLTQALSPHLAAQKDHVRISLDELRLPHSSKPMVIEGAGGVFAPINNDQHIIDIIAKFNFKTLIVARSGLGTINHTLLTLHALRSRAIPIWGVVMNGPLNPDNQKAIEHFGQVKVLAQIPPLTNLTPATLAAIPCPIPHP